jgi:hypothetical protein
MTGLFKFNGMKELMSLEHKHQLEEIKRNLTAAGAKESSFTRVEILFYDAMTIARAYGDDIAENGFLAAFKKLQAAEYQQTKAHFNKSVQRERVIRRFINSLKIVLSAGIKGAFVQPQLA